VNGTAALMQGIYYVMTGLWPLVSIGTFQQFPEDDKTHEPPSSPDGLFVNLYAKMPFLRERSEMLTRGVAMSIVASKGRKHLSADALLRLVRSGVATMPDDRGGETEMS
jgi:hypothetical protein